MIRVIDVRHVRDYVVWLRFSDDTEGEVDLRDELYGEVFEPLLDKRLFRAVAVHPKWHTVAWPNGADFAPEFLHAAVSTRERQVPWSTEHLDTPIHFATGMWNHAPSMQAFVTDAGLPWPVFVESEVQDLVSYLRERRAARPPAMQ